MSQNPPRPHPKKRPPANAGLTFTGIQALAIDPLTPATLYAGIREGGVFKSTDGGGTWSEASTGLTDSDSYNFV